MPFDIGESINSLCDYILTSHIISRIASNPVFTALTIALAVVICVLIVFRDIDSDESLLAMSLRTGFWVFLGCTCLLAIQNKVLLHEAYDARAGTNYDQILNAVPDINAEYHVPIGPAQAAS